MLRLLRGRTPDGEIAPAARIVAVLIILGMLAVAAPALFSVVAWVVELL